MQLPCAVVHPSTRAAIAAKLAITEEQLGDVLGGGFAYLPADAGGPLVAEHEFYQAHDDDDFEAHTCADGLAAHVPELLTHAVEIEPERAARLQLDRIPPPLDLIDALYVELRSHIAWLEHMRELNAPSILVRVCKAHIQATFDELVLARSEARPPDRWQAFPELMTGAPASVECSLPAPMFANTYAEDAAEPRDCLMLADGYLIMYPYASIVVGVDGRLRDVFPTCGLRPVGSAGSLIAFVSGGGPTAWSGYFSPTPSVRAVDAGAWVLGELPDGLPRYVAGTIADVKWAIVADLRRALGYRISARWQGDQCGGTTTSVDDIHAYDGGRFVVEAATGKPVLDMRPMDLEISSFVLRPDGRWRFVATPIVDDETYEEESIDPSPRVIDDNRVELLKLPLGAAALDLRGERVLSVTAERLQVIDVDTGEPLHRLDLAPLRPALELPAAEQRELWPTLLAVFGVAEKLVDQSPEHLRATLAEQMPWTPELDLQLLAQAIEIARGRPTLAAIERLPLL